VVEIRRKWNLPHLQRRWHADWLPCKCDL